MKFNLAKILLLFGLIVLELTVAAGDYTTLLKCGLEQSCWPHLNVEIVNVIRDNVRNTSDACNNFWDFACGEWKSPHKIHHNYTDNFGYLMDSYVNRMQEVLMSVRKESGVENLIRKINRYYQSCSSTAATFSSTRAYFDELPFGQGEQWRLGTWTENSKFNWIKAIAELRRYGLNGVFIEERATVAFNDSTKNIIELKMPDDNPDTEDFDYLQFVHILSFELPRTAKIDKLKEQLVELRKKHSRDIDATFEESLTLNQLREKLPNIDWQSYLSTLLDRDYIDSGEILIEVNGIGYLREVAVLLDQTDDGTIALYILANLFAYINNMHSQIRSQHCLNHMSTLMPLGLNYIYDRFIYSNSRQNDDEALQKIFKQLKNQFEQYIQLNKMHFNEIERNYLQEKIDKMTLQIGNIPIGNMPIEFYDHYYDTANITDNFYHNHWEMLRFRTMQQHRGVLLDNDDGHLDLNEFYVYDDIDQMRNAPYFVHERNLLIVPMVFMQLPFFHYTLQPLFQYSLVGFILGHEFNHAFEIDGIIMDGDGNESRIGFGIKQNKEFISKVKCFERTKTASLVERMADVNGFQLVYDAYFGSMIENGVQSSLFEGGGCGGDFTEKQLFFLNFAQFFCGSLPEPIDHDSDDVRVNEIVKDMPEFRKAFRCDAQISACEMWRRN